MHLMVLKVKSYVSNLLNNLLRAWNGSRQAAQNCCVSCLLDFLES